MSLSRVRRQRQAKVTEKALLSEMRI
uniref:Uncharacterized protein n=1 Tax=Anguilla anguilla TaxID=7936 RepID=A0A0E9VF20_ANGAN